MKKTLITIGISVGIIVLGVAIGLSISPTTQNQQNLSGYLVSTITNTSSSVGMADTLVNTPANYQLFYGKNIGSGDIDCTWTSTSTLTGAVVGTGLRFEAYNIASSTETSHTITDPNLLPKFMHCIANTTTSLSILKY